MDRLRRAVVFVGVTSIGASIAACEPSRAVDHRSPPPAVARNAPPSTTNEPAASNPPAATEPPASPQPPPRRPGAFANVDPNDDGIVAPPDLVPDCEGELARANVKFRAAALAVHEQKKSKIVCGAPQVVVYVSGPGKIAYSSPPLLTCGMALALASFEKLVQEEARATFGAPVVRIDHLGTYNCREMAAYPGWVSEHSYANAIDVARFVLANGKTIEVERDFDLQDPPRKPSGVFLRAVSRRANDEDVFSHVLTPYFDAHHKNHFHLDLARYRTDGTRPQG
ncbi:Extensin-like protein [Labilithrix luteola]|uniref:Extensin-like protein n=1 Tax=Labilithrix luteola TaxID=1391654 RepID=A0A0K1Q546_9BACT|nr:extensin family protein [Labilithrix luteola]AKV00772.1 Extensin-like protein [Labilithrix luteola]